MDEMHAQAVIRALDKIHEDLSALSKLKSLELEIQLYRLGLQHGMYGSEMKKMKEQLKEISIK